MKTFVRKIRRLLGNVWSPAGAALDFSHVDTREKAIALLQEGKLEELFLLPAEFGGEAVAKNIVYVPLGYSNIKHQLTGTLIRYFREGRINQLTVAPEYKGKSLVPSKISMRAWHTEKKGEFKPTMDIW